MTLLDVQNLHAGYPDKNVISGINFSVNDGELVCILGINGSGKTTLLKALCAILPYKGDVILCGKNIQSLTPRQIASMSGYIPQRCGIVINISVLDVVLMGFNPRLKLLEYPNSAMIQTARNALKQVGLDDKAGMDFQSLSEGQKQLCIIARTLLLDRGVMFLDEPESALDFGERYKNLRIVRNWTRDNGSAAVLTLHDPQLALNMCDRLLLLKDGVLFSTICPAADPIDEMEEKLSEIYGNLHVCRCTDKKGNEQLVLLKES